MAGLYQAFNPYNNLRNLLGCLAAIYKDEIIKKSRIKRKKTSNDYIFCGFRENTIDFRLLVAKMPRRTSEVRLEMETFDNLNVIESARPIRFRKKPKIANQ